MGRLKERDRDLLRQALTVAVWVFDDDAFASGLAYSETGNCLATLARDRFKIDLPLRNAEWRLYYYQRAKMATGENADVAAWQAAREGALEALAEATK